MTPTPPRSSKSRASALRAARAVAIGGAVAAIGSCGGRQDDVETDAPAGGAPVDEGSPTGGEPAAEGSGERRVVRPVDGTVGEVEAFPIGGAPPRAVELDAEARAGSGEGSGDATSCSKSPDELCPDGCDRESDADRCAEGSQGRGIWCFYDPTAGCVCAIEGPFAPPSFGA